MANKNMPFKKTWQSDNSGKGEKDEYQTIKDKYEIIRFIEEASPEELLSLRYKTLSLRQHRSEHTQD